MGLFDIQHVGEDSILFNDIALNGYMSRGQMNVRNSPMALRRTLYQMGKVRVGHILTAVNKDMMREKA